MKAVTVPNQLDGWMITAAEEVPRPLEQLSYSEVISRDVLALRQLGWWDCQEESPGTNLTETNFVRAASQVRALGSGG